MESNTPVQQPSSSKPDQVAYRKAIVRPRHRVLTIAAIATGIILVAVGSFAAGFSTGLQKARFSYAWGENYERNFMGPTTGPLGPSKFFKRMDGKMLRSGHGAAGEIISLNGNSIAVTSPDGEEWNLSISDSTKIKKGGESVAATQLEIGDRIVVLGRPNTDGVLVADFIRAIGRDDAQQIDTVLKKAGLPLPNVDRE